MSHVLLLGAVGQPRDVLIVIRKAQEKNSNATNNFKPLATSHWLPVNIPWQSKSHRHSPHPKGEEVHTVHGTREGVNISTMHYMVQRSTIN